MAPNLGVSERIRRPSGLDGPPPGDNLETAALRPSPEPVKPLEAFLCLFAAQRLSGASLAVVEILVLGQTIKGLEARAFRG